MELEISKSLNAGLQASPVRQMETEEDFQHRAWTFSEWCLTREAFSRWTNFQFLVIPLLLAGSSTWLELYWNPSPGMGRRIFKSLAALAILLVFVSGVRHASKAVCWELSGELRELVRLTGIGARTLLWSQTLSRWWTTALGVMAIVPLLLYAQLLGGVTTDQWVALICWLVLTAVLTGAFAMIASISSWHAANAETNAATATFLLMFLYHLFFWTTSFAVWAVGWMWTGSWTAPSVFRDVAWYFLKLAPFTGVFRAVTDPDAFSISSPTYWLHFLTAIVVARFANIVMQNTYRAITQPGTGPSRVVSSTTGAATPALLRPRCTDQPFYWKDRFILGSGEMSRSWWALISVLATFGIMASIAYQTSLFVGIFVLCAIPWIVAFQFDALMVAEFRDNTWNSLILLPIDPRQPILSKIRAAAWERRWLAVPAVVSLVVAARTDVVATLMATSISLLMGLLLIEISVLSQFNRKIWWAGPLVGISVIALIIFEVFVWVVLNRFASFAISVTSVSMLIAFLYTNINWRLHNWTEP